MILDTNVISELTRPAPDTRVLAWLDRQEPEDVFVTAISKAEVIFGLECMAVGRKRLDLVELYRRLFDIRFTGRVLPFDEDCAPVFAQLAAMAWKKGLNMGTPDLQIAAIAAFNQFSVATRNIDDFHHEGIGVINPWTD